MTRAEKFNKLGNAIRRYRGRTNGVGGKWISAPQPHARYAITDWLERLDIHPTEAMKAIDGFKSFDEFRAWMNAISAPPAPAPGEP